MLRVLAALVTAAVVAWPEAGIALSGFPGLATESEYLTYSVAVGQTAVFQLNCPNGYAFMGSTAGAAAYAPGVTTKSVVIDANSVAVDLSTAWFIPGGGITLSITNGGSAPLQGTLAISCLPPNAGTFTGKPIPFNIPALGAGTAAGQCTSPGAVVGYLSNLDGQNLGELYASYKYSLGSAFSYIDDLADGVNTFPTAFETGVFNRASTARPFYLTPLCANVPALQTFVYSVPTTPGNPFSIFAPLPDGYNYVGHTLVAGQFGRFTDFSLWGTNGVVTSVYAAGGYSLKDKLSVKGFYLDGVDTRPKSAVESKSTARAVLAVLVLPPTTSVPAPTNVTVVEFYNQALDHYFITANAQEISDLDNGVHKGWSRTGKSFKAYGVGSTGRTGRRPVCRAYGNPAVGLDSHFYSASPQECAATLTRFGNDWLLEASEVFEMDLPDTASGACPAGGVPIYRVWNGRKDSNHRYTTTLADQAQMVANGYIKEGYGPNAVTLCALQ